MRSILVHAFDDPCMEARLQAALDLARRFDAHLTLVHAIPYEFGVPGDFYGSMVAEMITEFHRQAKDMKAKYEERMSKEDVRWDWRTFDGAVGHALIRLSPLADVLVVGARSMFGTSIKPAYVANDLAGNVRPPILVVPEKVTGLKPDAPVTIAWNGSPEAGHAIQAAMPLLARASDVHVLCVDEDEKGREKLPVEAAASYLARHDIECEIVNIDRGDDDGLIAKKLFEASEHRRAEVMVAGAYGHSRFREWVLGGVTRDILHNPPISLMISH